MSWREALGGELVQGKTQAGPCQEGLWADGTPAALSGVCFNCWGTIASGSTALRAEGPTSDYPHHLSFFPSRLLPAARLVLTAFPRLQPSHCLKLLLFKSSHERFNSPSQVSAISNSNTQKFDMCFTRNVNRNLQAIYRDSQNITSKQWQLDTICPFVFPGW